MCPHHVFPCQKVGVCVSFSAMKDVPSEEAKGIALTNEYNVGGDRLRCDKKPWTGREIAIDCIVDTDVHTLERCGRQILYRSQISSLNIIRRCFINGTIDKISYLIVIYISITFRQSAEDILRVSE